LTAGLPRSNGVLDQVGVCNTWYGRWQPPANPASRGIYLDAKRPTRDESCSSAGRPTSAGGGVTDTGAPKALSVRACVIRSTLASPGILSAGAGPGDQGIAC
jgi:hypothetical protein